MEKYDLHMHSVYSDGSLTPLELLERAKKNEITGIAITDHDTIDAFVKEPDFQQKALDLGLTCITGVEFSTHHEGISVHILGYNFILDCPEILQLCAQHKVRRKQRNLAILQALKEHDMPVLEEELYNENNVSDVIGRPHIAQIMVDKGYVKSMQQAFSVWLGDKKPCFTQGPIYTIQETIEAIHAGGGKAVLAHPTLIRDDAFVKSILPLGFDGMECFYSSATPKHREQKMKQMAENHNLIITGGSDFHDSLKPSIQIGDSYTDAENFMRLCE